MEFEIAVREWFRQDAYEAYATWARDRGFPVMSEGDWRAKCVAAAILAASDAQGRADALEQSLAALRGVGVPH